MQPRLYQGSQHVIQRRRRTPTAEDDDAPIADTANGVLSVSLDQKEVILLCTAITVGLTMLSK
jgi:hypothetical protein